MALYGRYKQLSLGTKILIFMVLGMGAGIVYGERALVVQPLGDLFIRLLLMAAIPLVFFNLLAGLTSLSDITANRSRISTLHFNSAIRSESATLGGW